MESQGAGEGFPQRGHALAGDLGDGAGETDVDVILAASHTSSHVGSSSAQSLTRRGRLKGSRWRRGGGTSAV